MAILPYLEQSAIYNGLNMMAPFPSTHSNGSLANSLVLRVPVPVYQCPSVMEGYPTWFIVGTFDPENPWCTPLQLHYKGCMGGGVVPSGTGGSANPGNFNGDACSAGPSGNGIQQLWSAHFRNGVLQINGKNGSRDITDGSSNVILVGETYYDHMELNFWWACGLRTQHATKNIASGLCGTSDPINSGEALYKAGVNPASLTNQGVHNPIRHRVFGSMHPGGCHFLMADGSVHFLNENINLQLYRSLGKMADGLPAGGVPF